MTDEQLDAACDALGDAARLNFSDWDAGGGGIAWRADRDEGGAILVSGEHGPTHLVGPGETVCVGVYKTQQHLEDGHVDLSFDGSFEDACAWLRKQQEGGAL